MKSGIKSSKFCLHCIKNLENVNQYKYWEMSTKESFIHADCENVDLQYLEKNGYLLSSEISRHCVLYIPCKSKKRISCEGSIKFYCANPKQHDLYLNE